MFIAFSNAHWEPVSWGFGGPEFFKLKAFETSGENVKLSVNFCMARIKEIDNWVGEDFVCFRCCYLRPHSHGVDKSFFVKTFHLIGSCEIEEVDSFQRIIGDVPQFAPDDKFGELRGQVIRFSVKIHQHSIYEVAEERGLILDKPDTERVANTCEDVSHRNVVSKQS
ncbi:hypothetical protein AA313_de0204661 [Arthrobotrys entomopaga]|nr:hypothetical protein AA313_de0204661 [Arthrobotrys entomopaga]